MNTILEMLFLPGALLGEIVLLTTCKLGLNAKSMCILDHGSGTSTGEHVFMRVGNIIFYGVILLIIIFYLKKRKVKNSIR